MVFVLGSFSDRQRRHNYQINQIKINGGAAGPGQASLTSQVYCQFKVMMKDRLCYAIDGGIG